MVYTIYIILLAGRKGIRRQRASSNNQGNISLIAKLFSSL